MLEIISPEGISLDLPDDIAIEMEFNNPLFAEDELVGDYSLSFKLGWTDTNVKAFNHVNRIENRQRLGREYEGYTIKYGNSFLKGSLVVVEAPYKNFEVRFKSNLGSFKNLIQDKTLNNTELPETYLSFEEIGTPTWNLMDAKDISDLLLTLFNNFQQFGNISVLPMLFIPIINETAFDDNNQNAYFKHLNYYRKNGEYIFLPPIVSVDPDLPGVPFSWHNFTPCINFYYLLYKLITSNGYRIDAPVFARKDLRDLFTVGNNVYWHYYTFDINIDGQTKEFRDINGELSMPISPVKDLLIDFIKMFCVYCDINENTKTIELIAKEDILNDRSYVDITDITAPEINILKEEKIGYTFSYEFDDKDIALTEETIEPANAQKYLGEFNTFIDLPAANTVPINSVALVLENDTFYRTFRDDNVIDWQQGFQNFSSFKVGTAEKQIKVRSLNPTLNYRDIDLYVSLRNINLPRSWKIPRYGNQCKMESAYSLYYEAEDVRTQVPLLKLFFYRGFHNDSRTDNSTYPLGASDEYNYNGDVVGETSLKWHGERGLAKVWWNSYTEWRLKARPVEMYHKFDIASIFNPQIFWKKMIRVNNINYRIRNYKVTLFKNRIGIVKSKAYTAY